MEFTASAASAYASVWKGMAVIDCNIDGSIKLIHFRNIENINEVSEGKLESEKKHRPPITPPDTRKSKYQLKQLEISQANPASKAKPRNNSQSNPS